ncbi:piezo-type mechanosensitive ion channel homolog isoform X1 [Rhodamnia argentea]|uniref:Piezo-type mechanosensitive ion channel homolog isoform X1 n=2 Tax=Rhodamnia argentea TaxID=178133 RepID=A0A8B8QZ00_9MYRT|nr:piezo-type mechanosensitive ion channel homolog isoform X1 [Rhodamnia argentea]
MGSFISGVLLPLLLLAAALINWSLICLADLIAFLVFQFNVSKLGFRRHGPPWLLWSIIVFSILVMVCESIFLIVWAIHGGRWSEADASWAKLFGLLIVHSWKNPSAIYFLALHLLAVVVAFLQINWNRFGQIVSPDSCWGSFVSVIQHLGSRLRIAFCLVLPAVQLVVGISYPSWISLPFFVGSCVSLVDWSLSSNFLGLFRWWRALQIYAGFNIVLLYVYQLPVDFSEISNWIADFIGLYKISTSTEWPKICSGLSLVLFYMMLSHVKCNLEEMDLILSSNESSLTEHLLPSNSFFIRESRSGVRHTNVLLRGSVFRTFSINFFTYGFPVSLFALSFWSFHFASICAFGLLAYVGYIVYAFPSLFRLHRLNGLLLVFILLWAVATYVFNVAFAFLKGKLGKDMDIWEMVGLWHYPVPGFFLLAQFCLGVLVALGNLVNNSVFLSLSDEYGQHPNDDSYGEVEDTKVLIVATVAWGLRKCSRAIMLALIFLIAMKPGFIHAVYVIFFLMYLLSHEIGRKIRQSLILLCEAHFALLYILRIGLIFRTLEDTSSLGMQILSQLGLLDRDSSWDFLEIALLACFCAIHNHGFDMLFSFSAVVQHSPSTPIGFGILKAGLSKSVLLSVYASRNARCTQGNASSERRIALFLGAIGQKFLSVYRSCGTYIAFLTILLTVYLVTPNYISFGYILLLLCWIIGRQLVERTRRHLWFPLKAYAIAVFIFIYSLSNFSTFEMWMSGLIDLQFYLAYNSEASLWQNIWQSLAILIVMQLYSYERRQSKYIQSDDSELMESGALGFMKRLLIWHSDKIVYIAVFYASLSPISLFGFLYLLGLVICSILPKASRIPSKLFLLYTGILVMAEYLFQMLGAQAGMFPGQKNFSLASFLGFKLFQSGFWGLELGLRGKVLVISACTLQYNVFRWLQKVPTHFLSKDRTNEPCPLFVSAEEVFTDISNSNGESKPPADSPAIPCEGEGVRINFSSSASGFSQASSNIPKAGGSGGGSARKYSFGYIWGSTNESHKWNKKRIITMRRERFETQMTIFIVYIKFWMENLFNLFGLEINMVALLLACFALLNAISMLYIALLAACILLNRNVIRKLWPTLVFLLASILVLEYFVIWKSTLFANPQTSSEAEVHCNDCSQSSSSHLQYCESCWLGLTIDDSRVLISYFIVFMLACLKLRADHRSSFSGSYTYREVMSQRKNIFVWRDLSFETKSMWTVLDYLRLYCYCHLLDLVLALVLITGTLEYDILHLGYLAFALVFFRMRLTILKKRNRNFKFLRMYNFAVIVLSLAYQSPFVGDFCAKKCKTVNYIFEVIGFHKYDYGFRITARSALVEIIIFILVSVQSYMFSSQEFDYVFRYLEAEQIGTIVSEQEKKAAWKTAQLQYIRESEEKKRQRNMQVEKMKSEMLNLQIQLHSGISTANCDSTSPSSEGLRRRRSSLISNKDSGMWDKENSLLRRQDHAVSEESVFPFEFYDSPASMNAESPLVMNSADHSLEFSHCEITEAEEDGGGSLYDSDKREKVRGQAKDNPIVSAVQLLGDGVSQVQSIGNQAVSSLVTFLNIKPEDMDANEPTAQEDGKYEEMESQNLGFTDLNRSSSLPSDKSVDAASLQLGRILFHIWSQMQSNNDIVCYCCFVLVFLWNFSLLSMAYLAALFLYALCVNTGPTYIFWVIMLIYTEVYILLQYLYQIIVHHHIWTADSGLLHELGFPEHKMTSFFVIGILPLFLVYLFTLIQSSITAKDGEWTSSSEVNYRRVNALCRKEVAVRDSLSKKAEELLCHMINMVKMTIRNFFWYWKSLIRGAESPPYFVQVPMDVGLWPDDGIQPERIESGINQLLRIVHNERCTDRNPNLCPFSSRVHVQSIERSKEKMNIALAVFEVTYASPPTECASAEWYRSLTPASDVAKEIMLAQQSGFVEEMGFPYSILSVIGGGKREIDLYAYIFGADLTVFFLVAIFYQSVIKNKSEFLDVSQLEDQFPKEFVFILMIIFFMIVVDRVIYLCSYAVWKVIFYLFSLILFTYSVTEYAWRLGPSQQQAGVLALCAIYVAKSVSLSLQAIQVRYGIPHQSTLYRQFLTSRVARVNYLGYRLYRALPFLYELRCVLDWSCTTTSLTMYDWLKLEDIYASLYLVKCDAVLNRAKHKQGAKQTKMTKCCSGICLFFILIFVIWTPMLMYSSGNPTNIANPIKDASVQIDIKTIRGRLTLYQTTLCEKLQWFELNTDVDLDPEGYLDTFDKNDIQLICCQADATELWLVPNVVQSGFSKSLEHDVDMGISFTWVLTRNRPKGKELVKYERPVDHQDLPNRANIQKVLNGSSNSFRIYNIYPRYFRVTGSGEVRPLEQEVNAVSADLVLNRAERQWWSFHDINSSDVSGCGGLKGPMAIIVSEETPPQGILGDTLSKFSIWGLYITFVLAVGRFIRLQCADLRMRIPYENLPSCDRLMAICEDIYAARAEGELGVEEVLYWTLVKIYRSPHMLLEYTKPD